MRVVISQLSSLPTAPFTDTFAAIHSTNYHLRIHSSTPISRVSLPQKETVKSNIENERRKISTFCLKNASRGTKKYGGTDMLGCGFAIEIGRPISKMGQSTVHDLTSLMYIINPNAMPGWLIPRFFRPPKPKGDLC